MGTDDDIYDEHPHQEKKIFDSNENSKYTQTWSTAETKVL